MASNIASAPDLGEPPPVDDADIFEYCALPSCRRSFAQTAGRGRRREFCSDICRRRADRDYKRARARVTSLENLLTQARYDVAAFGRRPGEEDIPTLEAQHDAEASFRVALAKAETVLKYAPPGDPGLHEVLRELVDAAGPATRRQAARA